MEWFGSLVDEFEFVFVDGERYNQMIKGLLNTIKITFGALLVGIAIGVIVAAVRSSYDQSRESLKKAAE